MNEREQYLWNEDMKDIERNARRTSNRGGGGCVVALLVIAGGIMSVSCGFYHFFC